jgi:Ca2+-binding RTX toxin-like protein
VFAGIGNAPADILDPTRFSASTASATATTRILYEASTGKLSYDADGSGGASAPVVFAQLLNKPATLSASDFSVI